MCPCVSQDPATFVFLTGVGAAACNPPFLPPMHISDTLFHNISDSVAMSDVDKQMYSAFTRHDEYSPKSATGSEFQDAILSLQDDIHQYFKTEPDSIACGHGMLSAQQVTIDTAFCDANFRVLELDALRLDTVVANDSFESQFDSYLQKSSGVSQFDFDPFLDAHLFGIQPDQYSNQWVALNSWPNGMESIDNGMGLMPNSPFTTVESQVSRLYRNAKETPEWISVEYPGNLNAVCEFILGNNVPCSSVLFLSPKVAQRSYGSEKRFLSPQPIIYAFGPGWQGRSNIRCSVSVFEPNTLKSKRSKLSLQDPAQSAAAEGKDREAALMSGLNTAEGVIVPMDLSFESFQRISKSTANPDCNLAEHCHSVSFKDLYVNDTVKGNVRLSVSVMMN